MRQPSGASCEWCGRITNAGSTFVAHTPILEWMEERIDKMGRSLIWGENSDWSKLEMKPDFEAELLVYDQMLSTVRSAVVCKQCLRADERMWEKYYGNNSDDGEGDGGIFVELE